MLLELLPALVLLLLAVTGSMQLVWAALEHNRARTVAEWREGVLPIVWERWSQQESRLVFVREAPDGLVTRYFPDVDWLPPEAAGSGMEMQVVLQREPVELDSRPAWRISRLVAARHGRASWRGVLIVFKTPGHTVETGR